MKNRLLIAGMVLGLCVASLAAAQGSIRDAGGTRRALLVGINEYDPLYGPGSLPSCVNDALGVRDTVMLGDPGQRWPAATIQVLTNQQATAGEIHASLQALAAASQPGDLVLYAHSSHGGQYSGTRVYLCAYDQDYSAVSLGQDLSLFNSGVSVIVLVDACHSGGLFKQADGWPFAEMTMRAYTEAKAKQYQDQGLAAPKELGNNIAFMTACEYDQTCWAGDPYSLYIGTVITGCQDSAVDANHDGLYQFSELHTHAAELATQQNPGQTAQYYNWALLTSTVARAVGAASAPVMTVGDFDGDRKADPAICQESTGRWILALSASGYAITDLGAGFLGGSGYSAMTADYDGDGKADPAVYQASAGAWRLKLSGSGYGVVELAGFGGGACTPLAADFDGDGKADPAIIDTASGAWQVKLSGSGYLMATLLGFGGAGCTPLAADFDGDGKADPAIYRAAAGEWAIKLSGSGYGAAVLQEFGGSAWQALAADFDGDGKADPAVQDPAAGAWQIKLSASGYAAAALSGFGGAGSGSACAADYDGDGKADPGLYQSAAGTWRFRLSAGGYAPATLSSGYSP